MRLNCLLLGSTPDAAFVIDDLKDGSNVAELRKKVAQSIGIRNQTSIRLFKVTVEDLQFFDDRLKPAALKKVLEIDDMSDVDEMQHMAHVTEERLQTVIPYVKWLANPVESLESLFRKSHTDRNSVHLLVTVGIATSQHSYADSELDFAGTSAPPPSYGAVQAARIRPTILEKDEKSAIVESHATNNTEPTLERARTVISLGSNGTLFDEPHFNGSHDPLPPQPALVVPSTRPAPAFPTTATPVHLVESGASEMSTKITNISKDKKEIRNVRKYLIALIAGGMVVLAIIAVLLVFFLRGAKQASPADAAIFPPQTAITTTTSTSTSTSTSTPSSPSSSPTSVMIGNTDLTQPFTVAFEGLYCIDWSTINKLGVCPTIPFSVSQSSQWLKMQNDSLLHIANFMTHCVGESAPVMINSVPGTSVKVVPCTRTGTGIQATADGFGLPFSITSTGQIRTGSQCLTLTSTDLTGFQPFAIMNCIEMAQNQTFILSN